VPRWSEDPSHLLGMLANYLRLQNEAAAPDVKFQRAAAEAEAMLEDLAARASKRGRWRGRAVRFLLGRLRELAGLREAPKFYFVAILGRARALLKRVGEDLARAGRLRQEEDIFFLTLPEVRAALAGADMHLTIQERWEGYGRELRRRRVPRVLLSDGTEPEALLRPPETGIGGAQAAVLRGSPASAGVATAPARVILDPGGARLEPGEILVAPSTDPGWTPLFMTAGGLVMEMGGSMSHGAVVAREYGIPAVVGLPHATERIPTGSEITIDGGAGTVHLVAGPG